MNTTIEQNTAARRQHAATNHIGDQLLIEEYGALRSEIETRIELRLQLQLAVLVSAGTFISIGLQPGVSAITVLVYPLLALFIAASWAHNDLRIGQINVYLRAQEERYLGDGGGWETFRRRTFAATKRKEGAHALTSASGQIALSARGLFATADLVAVAIWCVRSYPLLFHWNTLPLSAVPTLVAIAVTVYTCFTLRHHRS